jgi:hypothetical protein
MQYYHKLLKNKKINLQTCINLTLTSLKNTLRKLIHSRFEDTIKV